MNNIKKVRIGDEFKPSPQFKNLYYIYLITGIVFGILIWYVPLLFIDPPEFIIDISIPIFLVIIFIVYWIPKYYNSMVYKLTKDEIEWRRGVWFKNTGIVPYNKITNIDVVQGPLSRMLGIATLKIQTAGYSGRLGAEIKIEGVENFNELKKLIMEFEKAKQVLVQKNMRRSTLVLRF